MNYRLLIREKYRMIIGYTGIITMGLAVVMLLPLLILPAYPEEIYTAPYFLISSLITLIIGLGAAKELRKERNSELTLQDGGVIVLLSWTITMILSALPFILEGNLGFTQAVFESVSGWTTTGLTVVDVGETSRVFLLWRSLMQYFGGAGLSVIMISAIIGPHGVGFYNAEGRGDQLLPNVSKTAKMIMMIYSGYLAAAIILYILAGMPWFDAVNHGMTALSTGGFSTQINSIGHYQSLGIEAITIVLMMIGAMNFVIHYGILTGKIKRAMKNGELRFFVFLLGIIIPLVSAFSLIPHYGKMDQGIRIAVFEFVSALSTTGFSTVGYNDWPIAPVFIIILLMIIGGGTGSTAGGIKLYRVYLLLKSLWWELIRFTKPKNSISEFYVYKGLDKLYVTEKHLRETANFVALYLITYLIGVSIFLFHGIPLKEAMFEFGSALGTVGLSLGITAPDLPGGMLWTQIIGMMLGRLEFLVVFYGGITIIQDIRRFSKANR